MSSNGRFVVFLTVVLSIWALMHTYVFWRLANVPFVAAHVSRRVLMMAAAVLWVSYLLARILNSHRLEMLGQPLEFVAATWIGILFLLFAVFLAADLITLGGWLWPEQAPTIRGWAAVIGGLLSLVGVIQGLRAPVVRDYTVHLQGLPPERDGLTLVALTDLHLGTLIGPRWMARQIRRVQAMQPDLVVIVGDLVDGNVGQVDTMLPVLKQLRAPLGVWAVTGNHEFYAGIDRSVALFEAAGYRVLRDRWAEVVPGLLLAGVDDLTARPPVKPASRPVEQALAYRPRGATILLSHSPWQAETAAAHGAGLMLSGHTHNGQLWPFNYLVQRQYPLLAGRYEVDGMPVIVCRGTGTWGPRMRLWRPSEMLRIKLKVASSQSAVAASGTP